MKTDIRKETEGRRKGEDRGKKRQAIYMKGENEAWTRNGENKAWKSKSTQTRAATKSNKKLTDLDTSKTSKRRPCVVSCTSDCLCFVESWWPRFNLSLLLAPAQAVCSQLPAPNPHCACTSALWPTSPWQRLHRTLTMQQRLVKGREV